MHHVPPRHSATSVTCTVRPASRLMTDLDGRHRWRALSATMRRLLTTGSLLRAAQSCSSGTLSSGHICSTIRFVGCRAGCGMFCSTFLLFSGPQASFRVYKEVRGMPLSSASSCTKLYESDDVFPTPRSSTKTALAIDHISSLCLISSLSPLS